VVKNAAGHKPDSVPAETECYHLSAIAITDYLDLPTQDRSSALTEK
jgi:hypothetical protein